MYTDSRLDTQAKPALTPVAALSRRDAVVAEIRRGIILGALQPGERLTELALAASLGVGRQTIREALAQLTRDGLIVAEPYRGLRVADLDAEAVRDLARTRVALDLLAVRGILADRSGGRLAAVRTAWDAFARTVHDPDPLVRHADHLRFHRSLWIASGNTMLVQLWPMIEANLMIAMAQDQALRPNTNRAHRMHLDLVAAIETRDLVLIEPALVLHNVTSADEYIALAVEERKPA